MGVSASACFRPLRAALFAGFPLIALVTIAAAEPLSDGVNAYARKEYATAKRILRPLAERGSAIAQFYLGLAYERGKSVSESEAEAVSWFRKAAEQGLAASQAALGTRLFYRLGRAAKLRRGDELVVKSRQAGQSQRPGYSRH